MIHEVVCYNHAFLLAISVAEHRLTNLWQSKKTFENGAICISGIEIIYKEFEIANIIFLGKNVFKIK